MSYYDTDPRDDPLNTPEDWAPMPPVLPAPPATLAEIDEVFVWLGEPVPDLDEPFLEELPVAAE